MTNTEVKWRGETHAVSGRIGALDGAQDSIEISKEGKICDALERKAKLALLDAQYEDGVRFYVGGRPVSKSIAKNYL